MNQEEKNRIKDDAMHLLTNHHGLPKQPDATDVAQLVQNAAMRINILRDYGKAMKAEFLASGKDVSDYRKPLSEDLREKYFTALGDYSKDELHILLTHHLLQLGLRELM